MTSEIDKLKHFHVENYSDTITLIYLFFLVIIVFNGKNVLV